MRTTCAWLLAMTVLISAPVWAAPPSAAFQGKTLTIVVGYPPGGGYDRMARLVGRFLERTLPGNPTVVIQNMPGAASIVAANSVYNSTRPDSFVLGAFNRNLVLAQLVKVDGVRFDMSKFNWIGSPSNETTVLVIRSDLPHRTVEDLRRAREPLHIGATGPGASTFDFPLLLKAFLGANLRIVAGYQAGTEVNLAIERREMDGRAGSFSSLKALIDRGLVRPIVRGRASAPEIEKLPVDEELASEPRARAVMALRSVPDIVGRPFVAPPGTPPDILQAYRDALSRMTRDREFITEATRGGFDIEHVSGEQALRITMQVLNAPPDVVRIFAQFFKFE
ncbi:MAG TPA: tripartite tricarboxylate transporter substrate-binding protein [bacterium]|nr:tripartite tricarboxylate transporter substrate-binding protein [bacterium]